MELLEFVKKYHHRKVDFDTYYGAQCVDLFRQYCKDVLQIPHTGSVAGAKDLWERYELLPKEKEHFEKHTAQPPSVGDVVVFGRSRTNNWGHVAIVLSADKNNMLVFEQDGFRQDGAKCAVWDYSRVLGFLRKRGAARV